MQVTCNTGDPADQWRCQLYCMSTSPFQWLSLLGAPLVVGFSFWHQMLLSNIPAFILAELLTVVVWVVLMGVMLWFMVLQRTANRMRICTTTLTPTGIVDVTPDGGGFIPWGRIRAVKCHKGDVYFLTANGGNFIPRSAFQGPEAAQAFVDIANAVRRGDYSALAAASGWAPPPPMQPHEMPHDVWPPPPAPTSPSFPMPPSGPGAPGWNEIQEMTRRSQRKKLLQTAQVGAVTWFLTTVVATAIRAVDPIHLVIAVALDVITLVICGTIFIVAWLIGRGY